MTRKGPLCGGRKHQGGGTCTQPAGWGTDHPGFGRCKLHAGASPSGRAAALAEQALAELERLGAAEPVGNPLEELARLAGRARKWEEILSAQVAALSSLTYTGNGSEQLRAIVPLWERALLMAQRFAESLARLRIDDRLARITAAQNQALADVMIRFADGLLAWHGTGNDPAAREEVARLLRALPDGPDAA